jgi:DNA primase
VFWPVGYTKGDLLAYYEKLWPWISPYLRDRPLVLTRPDGIEGKSFYQKNAPEFTPEWATRRAIDGTDCFVQRAAHVAARGIPARSRCTWSARLDHSSGPIG